MQEKNSTTKSHGLLMIELVLKMQALKFIDIHYHATPDLYLRRHQALDAGRRYKQLKGGVVLKSHLGGTSVQATLAQREGLPVFPSIVLNSICGGINYKVIIHALAEYDPVFPSKLLVHFPTITGRHHNSRLKRELSKSAINSDAFIPETIFNDSGKIRNEVIDVIKLSKDYPVVLSSGHASKEEVYALIDICQKYNVNALLLNQPANPLTDLKAEELASLNRCSFIWIEQTALTFLLGYQNESDFNAVLKNIKNTIYSSDLGQPTQLGIKEWYNWSESWFTKFNINTKRKDEICLKNPVMLLQL